jgi:hypothetical protein
LDPIRLHSSHSFQNDHVRLVPFGSGGCGTVRQTRLFQRQLKIPHVGVHLRQGGCFCACARWLAFIANEHRLRPLAASVPVPDAGNALGPKDMAGELIDDQLVNGTKMLTLEIVDGGPVDFLR